MRKIKTTKASVADLTPVVMTADTLMKLVERVTILERDNGDLRKLIASQRKELSDQIEEARQSAIDAIPELKDGNLIFESYNDNGDVVYGVVAADIRGTQ